jgi:hypothetical protein
MKISQLRQIIREEVEAMVRQPAEHKMVIRNYKDGPGNPETRAREFDKTTFENIMKMLADRFTKILSKDEARSVVGNSISEKDKNEIFIEPYYKFELRDGKDFLVHSRDNNTGKIGDRK